MRRAIATIFCSPCAETTEVVEDHMHARELQQPRRPSGRGSPHAEHSRRSLDAEDPIEAAEAGGAQNMWPQPQ